MLSGNGTIERDNEAHTFDTYKTFAAHQGAYITRHLHGDTQCTLRSGTA